ncbi:MAG: TIGR02270 family protein [Gammaproteobacteria bacterium]|nr:TIGR02270 family protein [Gammaproteobacteria bacterium]
MISGLDILNEMASQNVYKDIYEQYVDDAAFLWILRSVAIEKPYYKASDILELEQRIEARLDGLMTSLDPGWEACETALELQEPGEVFTSMVIAMRSHEAAKIKTAVDVGLENEIATPGLISAMGWLPAEIANPWTERFLKGKDMDHKYLGLATCSVRRTDPGEILTNILQRDDCRQHEKLYSRALRLVGELRRQDCMPTINTAMKADSENVQFWAIWSAALLGHRACIPDLQPLVFKTGAYQNMAIQLAFRILSVEQAREWISRLSEDESQIRAVIKATGVLGDPHAINWLIGKMQDPKLAKLAGESFTYITGVDLEKYHLLTDESESYSIIPDDDADVDDNVDLDEDENLPYPDAEKVAAVWRDRGQHFIVGRRYFMGRSITVELLKNKLVSGTQRQRHASALELALNENDVQLPNTRTRILAE